jgi:hypothetical protein
MQVRQLELLNKELELAVEDSQVEHNITMDTIVGINIEGDTEVEKIELKLGLDKAIKEILALLVVRVTE